MMKKNTILFSVLFILVATMLLSTGCISDSPQKIFEQTALNANLVTKFGSRDINHLLKENPETYDASQKKMIPSTYEAYFLFKISYIEQAEERIKKIKIDDDNKEIVTASLDLFSYAIAKEKEGYIPIAKMKDQKASEATINSAIMAFDKANSKMANQKFETLLAAAKAYAQKHQINANFQ